MIIPGSMFDDHGPHCKFNLNSPMYCLKLVPSNIHFSRLSKDGLHGQYFHDNNGATGMCFCEYCMFLFINGENAEKIGVTM